jgi:CO/xanthine dehydrogenase Mo-binding subunit
LPPILADNPQLDRWVSFPQPGKVGVRTGRVEIGQGVLTAMLQIAAEELDVAAERILLQSGDTDATPNEGFTAGSQSMQSGGIALRSACAEVRALFLQHAARRLGCDTAELTIRDGDVLRAGAATGETYWTLARVVRLDIKANGAPHKPIAAHAIVGREAARLDLPPKVFGVPVFIHDMVLDRMTHARVVRQPRGAVLEAVDEAAICRAAKGEIAFVRHGNFLAIVGDDETAVEAAGAAAANHVTWSGTETHNPLQQEANWLLQQPTIDRVVGAPEPAAAATRGQRLEATYTRGHLAHASIAPSCALAEYCDGHLTVWTHAQGVFPLRAELARTLGLDPKHITVRHVQGAGCYGHNGADDAAADAAIIATLRPGRPVRVRWRREEEFGFEPVSPAMVVKVSAALDDDGRPVDWTAEVWSGAHSGRPGSGNLLPADALPSPPSAPKVADVPDAAGGGATRNADPLYDFAAKRIIHHLIPETPVRTSALRGLGAMPNVFAIESFLDELAERVGQDPVAFRLAQLSDVRARAVIARVAAMAQWRKGEPSGSGHGRGIGFARYKNRAAYAAVVAEVEVDESVRVQRVWCAADAGLVINPDGAINQLEGGIIQSISWVLKEQVAIAAEGVSSLDWETYPVLRFSEVPEVFVELIRPDGDDVPLGVGEATAGPTAAAIGNAVSHALGTRIRDLPMTRDRIVGKLLAG